MFPAITTTTGKALRSLMTKSARSSSARTISTTININNTKIISSSAYSINNEKQQLQQLHKNAREMIQGDLNSMHTDICSMFKTDKDELKTICDYYFDGTGKSVRPMIICTMARIFNFNENSNADTTNASQLLDSQRQIALITEMIHVASLIHDDIVDASELRRGKASVNARWGSHKAVMAGDYVLATASRALAQIGDVRVVETLSQVLEDLVKGELMQLGAKESDSERFEHYTTKTYRKTASLIANSCKAVAILSQTNNVDNNKHRGLENKAFEFGKNVGMAFQLIDDVLDFTSESDKLGKPGKGADLRLGLATAPVLFASAQHPKLNSMIMRRFVHESDVEEAFEMVLKSDGIAETRFLAQKYCDNAESILENLKERQLNEFLRHTIRKMIYRDK